MNYFLEIKNSIIRKINTYELINISIKNKYNNSDEQIKAYIAFKGIEYLKSEYSYLPITDYTIQKPINKLNNYVYVILKSKNALTHPFVVYANINSNEVYIVMSYGKDKHLGQYKLDTFEDLLSEKWKTLLTPAEYYAIYLIIAESIQTRKIELITNDKYSLLNCSNITQCVASTNKIKKEQKNIKNIIHKKTLKKIDNKQINSLIKEKELYYRKKAVLLLQKYFSLLDNGKFEEAYNFLQIKKQGKRLNANAKYFGKERLDTFFKNNKKLIGHLKIFIDLYQFVHLLISRLN